MFNRLPALARFLLALIAIDLVVFTAFRGAFWAAFHETLANAPRADLLKALYLGFKFDLRLALLLCLPLALLGSIAPFGPARRPCTPAANPMTKWAKRATVAAFAALYVLGIWGKWSWYPLRWSEAYFSASEAVAALALNPVLFLSDTAENRTAPYGEAKVREHYAYTASLLGVKAPDPANLDFARYVTPPQNPAAKYNLVLIHLHSFPAFKTVPLRNR